MYKELILRSSKGVAVILVAGVMATLLHSESRRLYSWWWDSHNIPKNSKWLQDNLTDIDAKVKTMIKLIEEDADSFARRAEMYYKKRPELMKLVEEFYRAYRALAERYNHTTGELRHAHRTIARAFPDHEVPQEITEDSSSSPSRSSSSQEKDFLQVLELQCPVDSLFDSADSLEYVRHKGLKQLSEMFEAKEAEEVKRLKAENQNLKEKVLEESERAERGEIAIKGLEKALCDVEAEKENFFLQYQRCLEKLSKLEEELADANEQSLLLNGKAIRAEIEIQTLKQGLIELEAEKNDEFAKRNEYLTKISHLEGMISQAEIDVKKLESRDTESEAEALALKGEVSRLELEKESVVRQYKLCLEKISDLENVISAREEEAEKLKKKAEEAETEVSKVKRALDELHREKEAFAFKYKCCLEEISKLEKDLSVARDENEHLKSDVMVQTAKLRTVEDNLSLLEMSNRSLQFEARDLAVKIEKKDLELSGKQEELALVQTCLHDERLHHAQIESTLQSLQNLHAQSQENQRVLAVELNDVLRMLSDMRMLKHELEGEIKQVRDENSSLSDANSSSASSLEHMQDEVLSLREIKERLEKEVSHHTSICMSLQNEISHLKEEIKGLSGLYGTLIEQVEATGLDSKCLESSISSLRDKNSQLREICEEGDIEKAKLYQELEKMEQMLKKKTVLESSLTELNNVLEESHDKVKALEASCQFLQVEKASLFSEKASILSQLQAVTESMRNLLEKNAVLENSLSSAKVEVEGLREKSKGLAEICEMLKNERSYLLTERDVLVSKLESVEKKHEVLEKRFMSLEGKYADVEKEKESICSQVEKLELSLALEKQEQRSSLLLSETRLVQLENQICDLREENRCKKTEFEEELEKTIRAQFEISILQKFMKDLEERNSKLVVECQKHVEASKLAEKVISELESESLEQQVEAELLLDEIEGLRLGIYQIFKCLEEVDSSGFGPRGKIENQQIFVEHIMGSIEDMKTCISKHEDESQRFQVENLVLISLIEQLHVKGGEVESQKVQLERESKIISEKYDVVCNERERFVEMNERLKSDLSENHQYAAALKAELGSLCAQQDDLQKAFDVIRQAYSLAERENADVLKKVSALKEEKYMLDQLNDSMVLESLKNANESEVLMSFAMEKVEQLNSVLEDLSRQQQVNSDLVREMSALREKLDMQEMENLALKDTIFILETETCQMRDYNAQITREISMDRECLAQAEVKLIETEEKLTTVENLNSTLCGTVDRLKLEICESLKIRANQESAVNQLSEKDLVQTKEIESLLTANLKLESELDFLRDELQEHAMREQSLHCELEETNDEFELWEAEAATFYFDLQVCSIRDVLFENKVHELTEVCKNLQDDNAVKTSEIVEVKGKICSMESEISELKSQIDEYSRFMASLEDDVALLERNVMLQAKIKASQSQKPVVHAIATDLQTNASQVARADRSLLTLKDLQTRVKTVCKLMEEMNNPISRRRSNSKNGYESEIDQIKPIRAYELSETPKLGRLKSKNSESRDRLLLKDIPLDQVSNNSSLRRTHIRNNIGSDDQMLELWEEAAEGGNKDKTSLSFRVNGPDLIYSRYEDSKRKFEPPSTDSDIEKELGLDKSEQPLLHVRMAQEEVDDGKILAKLFSDAERLETLQKTVQHLRRKLEGICKKKGHLHRKAKNLNLDTVLEQLAEAEDSIVQLVDFNCQLVKNIEECPVADQTASPRAKETTRAWRMKVDEHAQKGTERIRGLQVEIQKIQYGLLKIEDDEDDDGGKKVRGKNVFLRNRSVVLRDFIYNGRRNSGKRKKGPFCGCFKESPSMSRNGR